MSSIIVYGPKHEVIDENTVPEPDNFYGMSKLQAEEGIKQLETNNFKIAIIRPPMIYGKGSKGNYQRLSKFAQKSPIFPDYKNKRSMLYIDNLSEFIKLLIIHEKSGVFFPQNKEFVCTSNLVKEIAKVHWKNIRLTKIFNPLIKMLQHAYVFNKLFGNFIYDPRISSFDFEYHKQDFVGTIESTEGVQ